MCVCVCVFPRFDLSHEFYPTELQHRGPVIHLFCSPGAIVIALVQCWFFIRHLFPKSPGSFSLLDRVWKDNSKPRATMPRSPSRQNFIPKWASDKWAGQRPWRGFGKEWCRLSSCFHLSRSYKECVSIQLSSKMWSKFCNSGKSQTKWMLVQKDHLS